MPRGFGRGMGYGRGLGYRWPGVGRGNPYPFCRAFPWLPRGWRWSGAYGPMTPYSYAPYGAYASYSPYAPYAYAPYSTPYAPY
jgi:hypothetical protein